jgi:serine protease
MPDSDTPDARHFRSSEYFTGYVIIRLRSDLRALRSEDLLHDSARSVAPRLASVLTEFKVKSARRLVTSVDMDVLLELERASASSALPPKNSLADYWRIDVTDWSDDLRHVTDALLKVPGVDDAYLDIHVVHASVNPSDDPLSAGQGYLGPAPAGIDAQWAWAQANGDGAGVGLADLEDGWNVKHQDLAAANPSVIVGVNRIVNVGNPPYSPAIGNDPNFFSWNHGTSALGVIGARDNAVGVVGIAPAAGPIRLASVWDGSTPGHVVDALAKAMTTLTAGDVVMLELQTARGNVTGWPDNHPIEIKDAERDAIRLAVSGCNLVVVAAAGNAGIDLDNYVSPQGASIGKRVLNRSSTDFEDSGSIMVGSATSTVPHRRMNAIGNQSNFGSRIDCYAWGENVSTCGAPDLFPDLNRQANQWYRTEYSGTSAATPIVAGAAILLQGIHKASTGMPLSALQMRVLLSDPANGTPPSPTMAAAKIGTMPDLRKLIDALALAPDIYLRDYVGDDGVVPSTGTLASSPDIIVRSAVSIDPQAEFGEGSVNQNRDDLDSSLVAGTNTTVYLRARNRGGSEAVDVVGRAWWSPPATLVTPDLWKLIGQTDPFTLAPDQSLTVSPPIAWGQTPPGHVCLIAAIGCARDPAPPTPNTYESWSDYEDLIRNWNNITWRNINVTPVTGGQPLLLPFRIVGGPKRPQLFDFEVSLSLPEGTEVLLETPEAIGKELQHSAELGPIRGPSEDRQGFRLPHRSRMNLRNVLIPPGSANEARVTVTVPAKAQRLNGSITLKQNLGSLEVGRITWRLTPVGTPRERA